MRCVKVLLHCFGRKFYLKAIPRLEKQTGLCTFSQEKVNIQTSESIKMFDFLESVNGMKVLDRKAFVKTVTVPTLVVEKQHLDFSLTLLSLYRLKVFSYQSVQETENDKKIILLDPEKVKSWKDFDKDTQGKLKEINVNEDAFTEAEIKLGYENWKAIELLKAILPKDGLPLTSYTQIGHIIHLNLKDHLLEYKQIIGEILLDKISNAKTVVYKKNVIDNIYRTSDMEVICGEHNFMVSVKENCAVFEFDFSKVYWNPRLGTEHLRIIKKINFGDALFDIFAGVGPFSIPAAKKKCMVHANDLNPESFKWLNHNINLNKKSKDNIKTYNKDGGDFILNDLKEELLKIWQDEFFCGKIHVVMNLPLLAPTFMKYFKDLITEDDLREKKLKGVCPLIVHCYFFLKEGNKRKFFEQESGMSLDGVEHVFDYVRAVSNYTHMHRITFTLPEEYLFEKSVVIVDNSEPSLKRIRTN